MITQISNLLLSSSKSMNVDGSSASKTFSYTASTDAAVLGMTCLLKDEGTTSFNKFGAITGLTNGILIQTTIGGNTTTIATIKDNADLCTRFHFNQFGNGATLSILGIATPQGFGASNNVFVGYIEFLYPVNLLLANGDTIQAIVQDNLTSVDLLEMAVKVAIGQ